MAWREGFVLASSTGENATPALSSANSAKAHEVRGEQGILPTPSSSGVEQLTPLVLYPLKARGLLAVMRLRPPRLLGSGPELLIA
ncbi:hypothetical protein MHYP_G00315020 [Metynnis hypsauchen]